MEATATSAQERAGRHLFHLPVIDLQTGTQVGKLSELVVDLERKVVVAFSVGLPPVGREERRIPFSSVRSFGKDAVTVLLNGEALPESDGETHVTLRPDGRRPHADRSDLRGKPVYTVSGERVGEVEDVRFSSLSGELVAFILAGDRRKSQLLALPVSDIRVVGRDAVIVAGAAAPTPELDEGRVSGEGRLGKIADDVARAADRGSKDAVRFLEQGFEETLSRAQEFSKQVTERIRRSSISGRGVAGEHLEKMRRLAEERGADLREKFTDWQARFQALRQKEPSAVERAAANGEPDAPELAEAGILIGKCADQTLTDAAGNVIVRAGEPIHERHIVHAQKAGKLYALFLVVAMGEIKGQLDEAERDLDIPWESDTPKS